MQPIANNADRLRPSGGIAMGERNVAENRGRIYENHAMRDMQCDRQNILITVTRSRSNRLRPLRSLSIR
jgi:hypothetical protein